MAWERRSCERVFRARLCVRQVQGGEVGEGGVEGGQVLVLGGVCCCVCKNGCVLSAGCFFLLLRGRVSFGYTLVVIIAVEAQGKRVHVRHGSTATEARWRGEGCCCWIRMRAGPVQFAGTTVAVAVDCPAWSAVL